MKFFPVAAIPIALISAAFLTPAASVCQNQLRGQSREHGKSETVSSTAVHSTISAPSPNVVEGELETTFQGGRWCYGNMFDVVALRNLTLNGMDIYVGAANGMNVKVYTKTGTHQGFERSPELWTNIFNADVLTNGYGKLTKLPSNLFSSVKIPANQRQAVYVTSEYTMTYFSIGSSPGGMFAANSDMQFFEGKIVNPLFSPRTSPGSNSVWNGVLHYSLDSRRIGTTFEGCDSDFGNMFDVVAKKNLTVDGMEIHTHSETSVIVEVYSKEGTFEGFQSKGSEWVLIGNTTVPGRGRGLPTPLPSGAFPPVYMHANETRAFYVTAMNSNLRSTEGSHVGSAFASNQDMELLEGNEVGYNFHFFHDRADDARVWNGNLYYSLQ